MADTAYVRTMPGAMARIAAVGRMKMRIWRFGQARLSAVQKTENAAHDTSAAVPFGP